MVGEAGRVHRVCLDIDGKTSYNAEAIKYSLKKISSTKQKVFDYSAQPTDSGEEYSMAIQGVEQTGRLY
jgi:hypothetical protein